MAKNKAEKIRSHWFPSASDSRSDEYLALLDRETRKLSTRSRNVMKTVVASAEDFADIFDSTSGTRNKLLTLRNLGMRSVLELETWWEQMDPATRAAMLGQPAVVQEALPPEENSEKAEAQHEAMPMETADRVAKRLVLTVHTLSVRSQNVLNNLLPDPDAYRTHLVLNPTLEQYLYGIRNLGRRSVEEICGWVENARQEIYLETLHLNAADVGVPTGSSWTRLSSTAIRALQEILGKARLASLPPQVPYVATPDSARNLCMTALLDALLFKPSADKANSALHDPYLQEIIAWLDEADVKSLTPIRLKGVWFELIKRIRKSETPQDGGRFANKKAMRNHLVWNDLVLRGATLEEVGKVFDITRERTRQIKVACEERLQRTTEDAVLDNCLIEASGQIWAFDEQTWRTIGVTDSLLWAGLAVRQGSPHHAPVWLGRRLHERLLSTLNNQIEQRGERDETALLQAVSSFFDGSVAPRPILAYAEQYLAAGLPPNALLRQQVLALLESAGKALSIEQIQAHLTPSPERGRLHSQILRLSRSGELISIGKRGFYMRPITGFTGTSFQYDDAARMYLATHPNHCACVEEILSHYVAITGIETTLHSFHTSLQIQAEKPNSPLVVLPFYHIGLKAETADLQRRAAKLNAQLITANLNHLRTRIPEPGTAAAERLIERFATKFRQDPEFISMAITHRHWSTFGQP